MVRVRPSRDITIAVAIHVVLALLLVVSIDWSDDRTPGGSAEEEPQVVKAKVVDDARLKAEKEARRKAAVKKAAAERKRQEANRRKAAEKKRVAKEQKRKAAVELKRKEQAARKAADQKVAAKRRQEEKIARKVAADKAAAEKAAAEEQMRQEDARKAAKERRKQEEEAARKAAEEKALQDQLRAEEAQLAARRAEKVRSILDHYRMLIRQKIERNWLRPSSSQGRLSCIVKVRPAPDGGVMSARIVEGSGDALYDRSVVNAVFKASPLPLPNDRALYDEFRDLEIKFDPED